MASEQWFLDQGVLGVMLLISLGFNWFLVKTVVNVIKENTIALISLKTLVESHEKK